MGVRENDISNWRFLLWIEMTGYDTEENKKNRQIICTILKEELKLVEKEELEEE